MAEIGYTQIQEPFVANKKLKLEDLNVALIIRLLGETNPAGSPSTNPAQIRGMKDLAEKFQIAQRFSELVDDSGAEVPQVVEYYRDVEGDGDLVRHLDPNWVVLNMKYLRVTQEDGKPIARADESRLGLLLDLLVRASTYESLKEYLQSPPVGHSLNIGELVAALKGERDRIQKTLDITRAVPTQEKP